MGRTILYIIVAYLSGDILYANLFGKLFGVRERYEESADKNPGTANAYTYGGFWCGTMTLICELAKGAVPVFLFIRSSAGIHTWALPIVLAAPVIGHIFPVFHKFHGGKGIAVTFGVLVGLLPYAKPLLIFAAAFIFLSVCVIVSPHYYRTIASYLVSVALMLLMNVEAEVCIGFVAVAALVCLRMVMSREEKEKLEVRLLWMR